MRKVRGNESKEGFNSTHVIVLIYEFNVCLPLTKQSTCILWSHIEVVPMERKKAGGCKNDVGNARQYFLSFLDKKAMLVCKEKSLHE